MQLHWTVYAFLFLYSMFLYLTTLKCGFVWDDRAAIISNKDVTGKSTYFELLQHDFWGQNIKNHDSHKSYRPVTTITYRLDHYWFGLSPAAFHLSNVIVHSLLCVVMLYFCTLWLTPEGIQPTLVD
jgi:hypothetical protein